MLSVSLEAGLGIPHGVSHRVGHGIGHGFGQWPITNGHGVGHGIGHRSYHRVSQLHSHHSHQMFQGSHIFQFQFPAQKKGRLRSFRYHGDNKRVTGRAFAIWKFMLVNIFPLPFDGSKIQMLQQLTWANIFLKCPIAVILCFEPFGCFSSRPADLSSVKLRWQIFLFPLFYFFPTFNLISFVSWIFFFRSCFSDGISNFMVLSIRSDTFVDEWWWWFIHENTCWCWWCCSADWTFCVTAASRFSLSLSLASSLGTSPQLTQMNIIVMI